jgi:hypothetical protein
MIFVNKSTVHEFISSKIVKATRGKLDDPYH